MTPKEKAKELTNKYKNTLMLFDDDIDSKKCAIIAVDEILDNNRWYNDYYNDEFWEEVRNELEAYNDK